MESILHQEENGSTYHLEALVDPRKLGNVGHDLKEKHNFRSPSFIKQLCSAISRENVVLYGLISGEEAISIDQTHGNVLIPVINTDQLRDNISKTLCEKERRKIGYIHISTIQIILKSTYSLGIKSPISLEISDDRFIDHETGLIATGTGDLAYGKIKFNVNYQVGMSLNDRQLDRSITLRYKLHGKQLMKDGNHPFSVTYRVNYALTNSHHSLSFRPGAKIEIDQLFTPIVQLDSPQRTMKFNTLSTAQCSRIQKDTSPSNVSQRNATFGLGGIRNITENQSQPIRLTNLDQRLQQISKELGYHQ